MSDVNWLIVSLSFAVGFVVGLTSMGSATLMTPFLILVVGVRPVLAVGTDLIYGMLTKLTGAWMHWKQDTVDLRGVVRLAYGSVPGGVLGVLALSRLQALGFDPDRAARHAISLALIAVGAMILLRTWRPGDDQLGAWFRGHAGICTPVWGAATGFVIGLTSVGSGTLIVPILLMLYPDRPARVVGTDLMHAVLLGSVTGLLHARAGNVDWALLPSLLLGSIPGIIAGSYAAPRMPVRGLRVAMSLVLIATGVKLG